MSEDIETRLAIEADACRDMHNPKRAAIYEQARAEIKRLRARVAELERENNFLRAVTGNSDKACVYCGLGAEEQSLCKSGFPGCARADDQMLCREVGVAMERDALRARVAELERQP